jgi:hypothetical protein
MFHDPLLSLYTKCLRSLKKKNPHFSLKIILFFPLILVSDKEINNSSSADIIPTGRIPVTSVLYSYSVAVSNPNINSSPSSSDIFHKNRHNSNSVLSVSYIGCPTRYRTPHFFNNFTTNEDITTKFEADLHTLQTTSFSFLTQRTYSCSNFVAISSLVLELLKKCRVR